MPTITLSELTGAWEPIYTRRLKLIDDGTAAVMTAWRAAAPDFTDLIHMVRARHGLEETVAPPDPAIAAAAAALLADLADDPELQDALVEWVTNAQAEGHVGALALAADAHGAVGFDFDLAFKDAIAAMSDMDSINADALQGLNKMVDGTAQELGARVADLVDEQATYDEMVTAVEDLFANSRAAAYWLDVTLASALSQGALDLYRSEQVTSVNWLTAGDSRVCEECEGNEAGGPYDPLFPMPIPPQHGFCRCTLQADDLGSPLWQAYVEDVLDEG